jgi:spore germination cell wall hydrolase CwlJ-like protein
LRSRQSRRELSDEEHNEYASLRRRPSKVRDVIPFLFGGAVLVAGFALAGSYLGQNAVAHNVDTVEASMALVGPTTDIIAKSSLMPAGDSLSIANLSSLTQEAVVADGKGDYINPDPTVAPPETKKVAKKITKVVITPAAVNLSKDVEQPAVKRLAIAPAPAKIEKSFALKPDEKRAVIAQRRVRLAEENCLARAVYFEARSETAMGQLAVAKVILNRVKDPNYPKTICGVVYQGSGRRNSCQFSFACDGMPDDVRQPGAWAHSKQIAQRAIAGTDNLKVMSTATNYHADYVRPRWAHNMKKLVKIGRHIFYSGG